jgi:hypothetical protein
MTLTGDPGSVTAIPDDATKTYLFDNHDEMLKAITRDKKGENLPVLRGPWMFRKAIVLGVQEPTEEGIDPEPVLRGLRADGYFIWPADNIEPFGTSQ